MDLINVLIVEDEKIVALDLKRSLTRLGYNVIGLEASASKVLELLKHQRPDIILMDIHIQGKTDGIQLTHEITEQYDIPIIYLTAYSEETTLERAKTTKPYGYLLKPFSERELDVSIQFAVERFNLDIKVKKSEVHLDMALEAANLGTWEFDCDASDFVISKEPGDVVHDKMSWSNLRQLILPEHHSKVQMAIDSLQSNQLLAQEVEFQIKTRTNELRWIKLYGKSYLDKKTNIVRVVGVIKENTERHDVEEQLAQAASVFKCTAEGIIILNNDLNVISFNQAFTTITQFSLESLLNQQIPFLTKDILGAMKYQNLWETIFKDGSWQGEIQAYRLDDSCVDLLVNINTLHNPDSTMSKYVVVVSDITALKEIQDRLSHIAYYDSLTSLPNRSLLLDRFQQAIGKAERDKSLIGVLFIDLDHFKRINDTMGHQIGDNMLKAIAQRLSSRLRKSDNIGRIGGDEFVVVMEQLESLEQIKALASNLLSVLAKPMTLNNTEVIPSGSIGISVYPTDATNREVLIQMADTAMYSAKKNGRNGYAFYSTEMTKNTLHYLVRERELHNAIKRQEFRLFFQPIISFDDLNINSFEALIRWQHPVKGLFPAMEVIPVAEMSYLIVDIGRWVLKQTCIQIKTLLDAGYDQIKIAVNVSIKQFISDDLPQYISYLLHKYRIPSSLLKIEITESCLQQDEQVITSLRKLNEMGIEIALDDFGTGYSCLSSLKNLPIKYLKIDQSFTRDIPGNLDDCAIAAAIIAMGHQLNKIIIAEGVENEEQLKFLSNIHCDLYQGYYASKPMPAENVLLYIKQHLESLQKLKKRENKLS